MCSGSEAGSDKRRIDFVYHSTLGLRVLRKKKTRWRTPPLSPRSATCALWSALEIKDRIKKHVGSVLEIKDRINMHAGSVLEIHDSRNMHVCNHACFCYPVSTRWRTPPQSPRAATLHVPYSLDSGQPTWQPLRIHPENARKSG